MKNNPKYVLVKSQKQKKERGESNPKVQKLYEKEDPQIMSY